MALELRMQLLKKIKSLLAKFSQLYPERKTSKAQFLHVLRKANFVCGANGAFVCVMSPYTHIYIYRDDSHQSEICGK